MAILIFLPLSFLLKKRINSTNALNSLPLTNLAGSFEANNLHGMIAINLS